MQEEQRAAEERVATLRGKLRQEKTKGDKRVADITRHYEEEKKRVEEQVMTFVIQWVKVVEKQLEIQAVLSDLIPEDARQDVTWTEVTQYGPSAEDIDLRIGQPLPLPDTSAGQSDVATEMPSAEHTVGNKGVEPRPPDRVMAFDPLTATPRRTFCMDNSQLKIQGDKDRPGIRSLVVADGGKIVMTDWLNKKVKVMDSRTLTIVSSLSLGIRFLL
nr:hypothetical protein BaRGS_003116 [Batillaria attramentaria]